MSEQKPNIFDLWSCIKRVLHIFHKKVTMSQDFCSPLFSGFSPFRFRTPYSAGKLFSYMGSISSWKKNSLFVCKCTLQYRGDSTKFLNPISSWSKICCTQDYAQNPFMSSGFTDIFRRFFGLKIIMVTPGCQW